MGTVSSFLSYPIQLFAIKLLATSVSCIFVCLLCVGILYLSRGEVEDYINVSGVVEGLLDIQTQFLTCLCGCTLHTSTHATYSCYC